MGCAPLDASILSIHLAPIGDASSVAPARCSHLSTLPLRAGGEPNQDDYDDDDCHHDTTITTLARVHWHRLLALYLALPATSLGVSEILVTILQHCLCAQARIGTNCSMAGYANH